VAQDAAALVRHSKRPVHLGAAVTRCVWTDPVVVRKQGFEDLAFPHEVLGNHLREFLRTAAKGRRNLREAPVVPLRATSGTAQIETKTTPGVKWV
jgi:hypothetical protein